MTDIIGPVDDAIRDLVAIAWWADTHEGGHVSIRYTLSNWEVLAACDELGTTPGPRHSQLADAVAGALQAVKNYEVQDGERRMQHAAKALAAVLPGVDESRARSVIHSLQRQTPPPRESQIVQDEDGWLHGTNTDRTV